jgi:hypothetical protein
MRFLHLATVTLLFAGVVEICGASIPEEALSFDSIKIGSTTFAQVQEKYGKSMASRLSDKDGAPASICYFFNSSKGKVFVSFESGAMGGWDRVTHVRITARPPRKDCPLISGNVPVTPGNGIHVGQSRSEFKKKFNVAFIATRTTLRYFEESKRDASAEELHRMQSTHLGEKRAQFDVIVEVKATFKNDLLVDYSVSKIESF